MILLVTILWSYDSSRWERCGTIGKKPRRSALRWLDLRVPFTEVVGPVLKAAQAGMNPASNVDLPTCEYTTAVPNYSYPILQEGELSSWFRLMLNHSCSFMRCSSAGNCRGRIFVRTDHQPGRSLQHRHSTRRILWFPQILGKFYTIDSLLLAIVFVGRTDNISPSYVASQLGILRGSRSRGVSAGFKHKERIPGLHSAEEGVRQLRMMKKS